MLPYKNPLAYKELRTWQQANEILKITEEFVKALPLNTPAKTHMDRSARSTVRNIEEGFRRTTTKEYIDFLGFSAGSNEELLADFEHCVKGNLGDAERAKKGFYLCKGESTMLFRQIKALEQKTIKEKTMSANDLARIELKRQVDEKKKFDEFLKNHLKGDKG